MKSLVGSLWISLLVAIIIQSAHTVTIDLNFVFNNYGLTSLELYQFVRQDKTLLHRIFRVTAAVGVFSCVQGWVGIEGFKERFIYQLKDIFMNCI